MNQALTYAERSQWYAVMENAAIRGLQAKFQQNPELIKQLLKTRHSDLVYCAVDEGFWGVGLDKSDAAKLDHSLWPGKNRLGQMLQKLRSKYAKETQYDI